MMGYETKLIVGLDTKNSYNDDGIYFMPDAHVDLCKLGNSALYDLSWQNKNPHKNKWFIYPIAGDGDGDTTVSEDSYGDKFQPIPIEEVIDALIEDIEDINSSIGLLENDIIDINEKLEPLNRLLNDIESYSNDSIIINESHFEDYARELVKDFEVEIPHYIVVDWTATAGNIQTDYTTVDYDGATYYTR